MPEYIRARPVQEVTSIEEVESILKDLQDACGQWHAMPRKQKRGLLQQVRGRALKASVDIGKAVAKTSGMVDASNPDNVHWPAANMNGLFIGPAFAKCCTSFIQQLDELERHGKMKAVPVARKTVDGRSVLDMGECGTAMDILLKGSHAWQYTQTSTEVTQGKEAAAVQRIAPTGPAVLLGGGNQAMLCGEDSLHTLFDEGLPVLLKHHPAQAEVAPMWEYVFEPLAKAGVYKGIFADHELTQAALYSQCTAAAHVTGALKTYEDLLWGPGEEGRARKAADEPILKVPFTAELGNVTPVLVTPGPWTHAELANAAKLIAFGTINNAGCNCPAPRVIVMSAEWPQADEFEGVLKEAFRVSPSSPCWYPGSKKRYEAFLAAHPSCDLVPSTTPEATTYSAEVLPWAFHSVTLASPADAASLPGLQEEFFAPVVILLRVPTVAAATGATGASVALASHASLESNGEGPCEEASDSELSDGDKQAAHGFLRSMPAFTEQYIFGNLTCSIFLPDSTKAALPESAQTCVDNLRYGSIVVNNLSLVSYFCQQGCWGGHTCPESSQRNVGSGLGKLHNFSQVDSLEKLVLEFPWGHSLNFPEPSSIPGFLVPALAGVTGGGLRGVWAALTPW